MGKFSYRGLNIPSFSCLLGWFYLEAHFPCHIITMLEATSEQTKLNTSTNTWFHSSS